MTAQADEALKKFLEEEFLKVDEAVKRDEMKDVVRLVEEVLFDAASSHEDFREVVDRVGLTDEMIENAMRAAGGNETEKVLAAFEKAKKELEDQAEESKKNHGNDTSRFEEEGVDHEGRRILRFVPDPTTLTYKDEMDQLKEDLHRRSVSRQKLLKDSDDFAQRLMDHIEELAGHIREVQGMAAESMSVSHTNSPSIDGIYYRRFSQY